MKIMRDRAGQLESVRCAAGQTWDRGNAPANTISGGGSLDPLSEPDLTTEFREGQMAEFDVSVTSLIIGKPGIDGPGAGDPNTAWQLDFFANDQFLFTYSNPDVPFDRTTSTGTGGYPGFGDIFHVSSPDGTLNLRASGVELDEPRNADDPLPTAEVDLFTPGAETRGVNVSVSGTTLDINFDAENAGFAYNVGWEISFGPVGGVPNPVSGIFVISRDFIEGGDGDDTLIGVGGPNINGYNGDDLIIGAGAFALGGDGDDTIVGGDGRNTIFGERGDDLMIGGAGGDTFRTTSGGSFGNDRVTDFTRDEDILVFEGLSDVNQVVQTPTTDGLLISVAGPFTTGTVLLIGVDQALPARVEEQLGVLIG
jgi:Ca2+-binding RTX toxin-like protein